MILIVLLFCFLRSFLKSRRTTQPGYIYEGTVTLPKVQKNSPTLLKSKAGPGLD